MATLTVTTLNDVVNASDGVTSLREAISAASAGDTIVFAAGLSGGTLTLTQGDLALTQTITIDGDTNGDDIADITISGDADGSGSGNAGDSRIFNVTGATTIASIASLNLEAGYTGAGGVGGAIYVNGATLNVSDTTLEENQAGFGGAIFSILGTVNLSSVTLSENTATSTGGGLYAVNSSTVNAVNTTFAYNESQVYGGAIGIGAGSDVILTNTTVSENYAISSGGGIDLFSGTLTTQNTVIAQNTITAGAVENDINAGSGILGAQNSFFGTTVTIDVDNGYNTNTGGNAGLQSLGDNGGTVHTMAINGFTSPLYNAGANYLIPYGVETSANGQGRTTGVATDIGAFESGTIVTTLNDVVNPSDGLLSLREAVALGNAGTLTSAITFDPSLAGGTITLTGGQLDLTNSMWIDGDISGDGRADIIIDGDNTSRIFEITGGGQVGLQSLTLVNGYANDGNGGGAIRVDGAELVLWRSTLLENESTGNAGAVEVHNSFADPSSPFSSGAVLASVAILGNIAAVDGGGIGTYNSSVGVYNSTLYFNSAGNNAGGAGIVAGTSGGTLNFISSTIVSNYAGANYGAGGVGTYGAYVGFFDTVVAQNYSNTSAGYGSYLADDVGQSPTALVGAGGSFFGTTVSITGTNSGYNQNNAGNPLLGQILDNGGAVATMAPINTSATTSPLIDTGQIFGLVPDLLDEDGDGNTTEMAPVDGRMGARVIGADIDIGAVEYTDDEIIRGLDLSLPGVPVDDIIIGGLGEDTLIGGTGDDTVDGGEGGDTIISTTSDGNDTYTGGNGFDVLDFSAVGGVVQVNQFGGVVTGSAGNDTLTDIFEQVIGTNFDDVLAGGNGINVLDGNGGNDLFWGNGGIDLLRGGDGNDTFFAITSDGDDVIEGNAGFDILNYSTVGGVIQLNMFTNSTTGSAGNDTFSGIEYVIGSNFGDVIAGNNGINAFEGGAGDDQLFGNGGIDWMNGGTGNDTITLGFGDDTLQFRMGDEVDTITDFNAGAGSEDTIDLRLAGTGFGSLLDMQNAGAITQVGADTHIDLAGADQIILQNVTATNLHDDDFVF